MLIAAQMGELHLQQGKTLETLEIPNLDEMEGQEAAPEDTGSDGSNEQSGDEGGSSDHRGMEGQDRRDAATNWKKKGANGKKEKDSVSAKTRRARPHAVKISKDERQKILTFFQGEIRDRKNITQMKALSYIKVEKSGLDWLQVKSVVSNKILTLKHNKRE